MSAGGFAAARPGHIWKIPSVLIRMPTGPRPVRATGRDLRCPAGGPTSLTGPSLLNHRAANRCTWILMAISSLFPSASVVDPWMIESYRHKVPLWPSPSPAGFIPMPAGTGRRRNQPCRPAGIVMAPFLTATAFQSVIDWSSARNSYDAGEISRTAGGRERAVQPPSSDCNGPSVPILKPTGPQPGGADNNGLVDRAVYNTYPIENFSIYLMPKQPAPI
ncbi:hypothetical protein PGT21_017929 [Puccinia graminis f. sp. tritici]|uniref:Uncharacterized protein n=1 Tax=Puccinia graminis f. sp. tritici TaxID=56615 RepID=A0A5B0MNZ4_PUCGR|nr:hypothetical protein PGT21_017929 [Puccinia graminis f. sp. tritici]